MRNISADGQILWAAADMMGLDNIETWANAMLESCHQAGALIGQLDQIKAADTEGTITPSQLASAEALRDAHSHITREVERLMDLIASYKPLIEQAEAAMQDPK